MRRELSSNDPARFFEKYSNIIKSEPTVPIQLRNNSTGRVRTEWINREFWDGAWGQRLCELYWQKAGDEVIENLSQTLQECDTLRRAGFCIDDNSGKVVDLVILPR